MRGLFGYGTLGYANLKKTALIELDKDSFDEIQFENWEKSDSQVIIDYIYDKYTDSINIIQEYIQKRKELNDQIKRFNDNLDLQFINFKLNFENSNVTYAIDKLDKLYVSHAALALLKIKNESIFDQLYQIYYTMRNNFTEEELYNDFGGTIFSTRFIFGEDLFTEFGSVVRNESIFQRCEKYLKILQEKGLV